MRQADRARAHRTADEVRQAIAHNTERAECTALAAWVRRKQSVDGFARRTWEAA